MADLMDPTDRNQAPTTGRQTQSPQEAHDLVTEGLSQLVTKRAKLAEHDTDSSGSTQVSYSFVVEIM
ncbi:hypothetical protein QTP88_003584 [Uroleucon formosanum]